MLLGVLISGIVSLNPSVFMLKGSDKMRVLCNRYCDYLFGIILQDVKALAAACPDPRDTNPKDGPSKPSLKRSKVPAKNADVPRFAAQIQREAGLPHVLHSETAFWGQNLPPSSGEACLRTMQNNVIQKSREDYRV